MKNNNIFKKIGGEFLLGILEVLATSFETKIGFGVFSLILGLALLFAPKGEEISIIIFNLIGFILIIIAFLLFRSRIKELKNKKITYEK